MNRDEALFYEALERGNSAAAAAFLDQACAGDEALRSRVERLVAAHGGQDSLLDHPANVAVATCDTLPAVSERAGDKIGPYKLIQQIGEGGMGVVYMAQQTEPVKRLVALKIIKPGMDSRQVIARFEAERQALALMDHPNIAKVLDAGTTGDEGPGTSGQEPASSSQASGSRRLAPSARPYFVMELVKGIPITTYCDEKHLTPRERLELFIPVCHAVQHAHQKGIIHRDLKPTNVLIALYDGRPVPKVIDFGVAKATGGQLTDKTLVTNFGSLVGTVEYMSPEQAELNQLDVDTRSDIYALGVLLYELLTGETPLDRQRFRTVAFNEMLRIIREEEPETVSMRLARTRRVGSAHHHAASGVAMSHKANQGVSPAVNPKSKIQNLKSSELDWIVMKALEKDRSRRYESASSLAADIQRYLSDEPVLACPPTAMYRFQKFARKHKPALVTAAAIALCLLLGTTVSAWQAVRATTAEAQATANEQKAVANAITAQEKEQEAVKQRDEVKALADKLVAKEEELERTLYADHIYMAKEAWDAGNVDRVKSLLNQHRAMPGESDRRGFEWHYLNRLLSAGPLLSFRAPLNRPNQFTLNPDRTRLILFKLIGSRDVRNGRPVTTGPELHVWNLQTGQQELTAALPGATVSGGYKQPKLILSPDTRWMATNSGRWDNNTQAYFAGDVKVWDTKDGKLILSIAGVIGGGVFSPDSKLLATAMEDQSVKLWDLQAGQEQLTLKGQLELPHAVAFSPDGKRLAAAGNKWDQAKKTAIDGEVKIWEVPTGEPVQTLKGYKKWMNSLVFSPDGQLLATEDGNFEIKLWDTHTGDELRTFSADSISGDQLQFNASGDRLIGTGKDKMWNTQTGQEMLSAEDGVLQFSPDGKCVALVDWANSRTKVFDAQSGKIMLSVKDAGGEVAFSPDSKRLATESGGMRIWDLETGDEINHIKGFTSDSMLAFSQDGKRLIGGDHQSSVQVWDAEIEQQSAKKILLPGVQLSFLIRGGSPAVISSDFTRVAGISGKTVKLFDAQTGQKLRTLTGHDNNVLCVAFSQDGKRIASSDGQPNSSTAGVTVKVWDAETGKELFTIAGLPHRILLLKFSPDGKKLAGTPVDRTVTVWDASSGRELYGLGTRSPTFTESNFYTLPMFAFSPDGKRLGWKGKIWDAGTGDELVTLKGAVNSIRNPQVDSTEFSPDGKRVVGGIALPNRQSAHGVWDAETGELLFTIDKMGCPTFSPDGKRLSDGGKVWDAQTGKELLSLGSGLHGQVAFSPDGHRLAVVKGMSNEFTIYDATPLRTP